MMSKMVRVQSEWPIDGVQGDRIVKSIGVVEEKERTPS
jgi:hypothetical protein